MLTKGDTWIRHFCVAELFKVFCELSSNYFGLLVQENSIIEYAECGIVIDPSPSNAAYMHRSAGQHWFG